MPQVQIQLPPNQHFSVNQLLQGTIPVDVTFPDGSTKTIDAPLKDLIDWDSYDPISFNINRSHCETPIMKKHKCDQCDKSFTQSRNRRRHIKANHK